MPLTDDLYREIILEHFKSPRNAGRLENPSLTSQGANPFCGDEMELTAALDTDRIQDIRIQARGCSISQASASMMSEAVKGKPIRFAEELAQQFKATMLEGAPVGNGPEWEDLQALEGVKKYPVRIKCALLCWNTLLEGIGAFRKGEKKAVHTEIGEPDAEPAAQPANPAASAPASSPADPPDGSPEEQVRAALTKVIDPELNLNIVDLGLVYATAVNGGSVQVTYTLTSPGCPLGPVIKGQVQSALSKLPWVKEVHTELVWQPPWDPKTMASEEIKTELGIW